MAASLLKSRVVFQLPAKGTWFENVAVRADGSLLATRVDTPEVWLVDQLTGTGSVLVTVPAPATSLTGITELGPDVFAIAGGQYDMAKGAIQGSWAIWVFSLADGTSSAQSTLREVCKTPDAGLINGMTTWDKSTVLAVDSTHGPIYSIDVENGTSSVAATDELATCPEGAFIPIGINGIKVRDGHVYFTNTSRMSFCRMPFGADCKPTGPAEVVVSGFPSDDFTFDETDGAAYIVTHPQNTVVRVAAGSTEVVTVAGANDSLEIAGGTACAFGRTDKDKRTLYVVTAGALSMPVNGEIEPAKIVAVDIV